jgi:hypothetical protein
MIGHRKPDRPLEAAEMPIMPDTAIPAAIT